MESPWQFVTDSRFDAFCRWIVAEMVRSFGVSEEEAVGRINKGWGGRGLSFLGEFDLIYHELPGYWANLMYWGDASYWWIPEEKREHLGLGPLTPSPYP